MIDGSLTPLWDAINTLADRVTQNEDDISSLPTFEDVQDMVEGSISVLTPLWDEINLLTTALNLLTDGVAVNEGNIAQNASDILSMQTQVDQNTSDIGDLQEATPKQLKVYDVNNQYLGLLVDRDGSSGFTVFLESLGKIVAVTGQSHVGAMLTAYYETEHCTGTPYAVYYDTRFYNDTIVRLGDGTYAYYANDNGGNVTVKTKLEGDGSCVNTTTPSPPYQFIELTLTPYPFGSPIQTPYDVRYE